MQLEQSLGRHSSTRARGKCRVKNRATPLLLCLFGCVMDGGTLEINKAIRLGRAWRVLIQTFLFPFGYHLVRLLLRTVFCSARENRVRRPRPSRTHGASKIATS